MARMCAAAGLMVRVHAGASASPNDPCPTGQQQADAKDEDCVGLAERTAALAFDLLARVTETGAGWRLLAPQFGALVQNAIFPALCLRPADVALWHEDPEEYLLRYLP